MVCKGFVNGLTMLANLLFKKHIPSFSVLCLLGFLPLAQAEPGQSNVSPDSAYKVNVFSNLAPLDQADYQWIGAKIYQNECNSQPKYLTFWGKGEDFPSFGIGHFIWFPKAVEPPFNETFPAMFEFVSDRVAPPDWLLKLETLDAPWQTKAEFEQAWSSPELTQLREWLQQTQALQAQFIVQQFQSRFMSVLNALPEHEQTFYKAQVAKLMGFKQGYFALIDYVNFKGVGGNPKEQYQGQEWGLLSVLKAMNLPRENSKTGDDEILNGFIQAAKQRLLLRTQLAPAERNEQRWLKGWFQRLDNYRQDDFKPL